jgi:ketosteroid isomerase-like protein
MSRDDEPATSQENAIRAGYGALSAGDVDAWLETLDPEIELRTSGAFPDIAPIYRGYDGMRKFWDEIRAPWEWFHLDPERILEGEGCAAVAVRFRVRGAGSGVVTELNQGHALWLKDGRTVRVSTHRSFEEALAAVGLGPT